LFIRFSCPLRASRFIPAYLAVSNLEALKNVMVAKRVALKKHVRWVKRFLVCSNNHAHQDEKLFVS
jgi:hypothetical protein